MKPKFISAYMDVAERFAQLSSAQKLKVGAIIVRDDRIVSIGFNGTPSGWDNTCEDKVRPDVDSSDWLDPSAFQEIYPLKDSQGPYQLKTRDEVLHAEMNALMKLARSSEQGEDAALFVTHSPCMDCAKAIYQAGIIQVFYRDDYRCRKGVEFLERCGIQVTQWNQKS